MRRRPYRPGPFGYRTYGYGYGPPRRGGSSCARDACLLESGCCIAEALGDSCLIAFFAGRLLAALKHPRRTRLDGGLLLSVIRAYQEQISPRRPTCCRFTPSCSRYAKQALTTYGNWRGGSLAVRRLCRCRPYGRRGADPVPAA